MAAKLASLTTRRSALLIVAFCCAFCVHAHWGSSTASAQELPPLAAPAAPRIRHPSPSEPPKPSQSAQPQHSPRGRKPPAKNPRRAGRRPAASQPASAPAAEPTTLDDEQPIAEARRRLGRIPAARRTPEQTVLMRALDFALAIGQADGKKAASLIDAAGYQILPLEGDLPETPAKPQAPSVMEQTISARAAAAIDQLPLELFEVQRAAAVRESFPAVATWMLAAEDYAVIFHPPTSAPSVATPTTAPAQPRTAGSVPGWLTRDACIVIRLRADRPTILGGNLLGALANASRVASAGAEAPADPGDDR